MSNILEYKGYQGSVEFSAEDGLLFGKVLFINDSLMFHGGSVEEVLIGFQEVVDDYLLFCEEQGVVPDQPFKGTFNVRIGPELHRAAALASTRQHVNLNEFVRNAVAEKIDRLAGDKLSPNIHHHYHVVFQNEIDTYSDETLFTSTPLHFGAASVITSSSHTSHRLPFQMTTRGN